LQRVRLRFNSKHFLKTSRSIIMNNDIIQGKWKQLAGSIQKQWGKLTDDDLTVAEGTRDYLSGKIQERYGIAKDAAEDQIKEFEKTLN
jgi:uncharacterized protein YjbJ (UPF0337 family)